MLKKCLEKIMNKIFKLEEKSHYLQTEDKPEHQHEQELKVKIAKNEAINKLQLNERKQ